MVTEYLAAHGYRYAIVEGIALAQWGVIRPLAVMKG